MSAIAASVATKFTAIDKFTGVVSKMGAATQGFAAKAEIATARANRAFNSIISPVRRLGRMLGQFGLVLGATAVIGVFGNVINTFKDFEQANANLASVLGVSNDKIVRLNNDAKRLGATTAFTASQVAGLQTEFAKLGFSQDEILASTEATLALAAATNTELPQAATQVGAAIRAFGLDASEATRVADVFAASTSKSALDMEKLNTAMSTVAPVAKQFSFSVEDTTALLGKLSDAGFDSSTAATSTRNIILNLADSNGKLAKSLGRPVKSLDDMVAGMVELRGKGVNLAKMLDLTDKRSVAAFATFLDGAEGVGKLADELRAAGGAAQRMAEQQLNTLQGSFTKLSSAWEGFILSNEDGQGSMARTIRTVVDTATEMLSLASGVGKAESELSEKERTIRKYALIAGKVIKVVAILTGALLAFKVVIVATNTMLAIYNGAMKAYAFMAKAVTTAQWLWNAAMTANPIGLIIVGVAALIALIAVIVNKWNEWGAAVSLFLGPIGMVISLIQSFRRNWDLIKESFKTGGIVAGLKMIGKTILDAILMPLQQLLELASNIPGIGDFAAKGAEKILKFRQDLGVNTTTDESGNPIQNSSAVTGQDAPLVFTSPAAARNENLVQTMETIQKQRVSLDINNNTGYSANVKTDNDLIPIGLTSTQGF